jgi:hypothetical protein
MMRLFSGKGQIFIICKIVLLGFAHRLNYKIIKLQRFVSWFLLSNSGIKGVKRTEACLLDTLVELASDLRPGPGLRLMTLLE